MSDEYEKVIRDTVYGYVGITVEQLALMELSVFQRLRRISQLSFADLAYPNAMHNRFSHSVGVMHLGSIISRYRVIRIEYRNDAELKALLEALAKVPTLGVQVAGYRK